MHPTVIPPPIVSSTYALSSPATPSPTAPVQPILDNDDLSFFRRKEAQLEADLQLLIDAQAEALLSALSPPPVDQDANLSTRSTTPTARTSNPRSSSTSSTPATKNLPKLGLRQVRKALYTTMRRLALLKAQEHDYLAPHHDECDAIVAELDAIDHKRTRLNEKTRHIQHADQHTKASELRQQADDLQDDINDLETRLSYMKTRQTKLRAEAQECENDAQAKLSSYTASLAILEKRESEFVRSLHLQDRLDPHLLRPSMAAKRDRLRAKQRDVDREREALEQGAAVWKDVVSHVSDFERHLSDDMTRFSSSNDQQSSQDNHEPDADGRIKDLLSQLDQTTTQLESRYKLAQSRNWTLLVAVVGAELEAFLKGKDILDSALAAAEKDRDHGPDSAATPSGEDVLAQSMFDDFRTPISSVIKYKDEGEAIRDLDQAFAAEQDHTGTLVSDTDTEDDGPDPELLISHQQDTDTD